MQKHLVSIKQHVLMILRLKEGLDLCCGLREINLVALFRKEDVVNFSSVLNTHVRSG